VLSRAGLFIVLPVVSVALRYLSNEVLERLIMHKFHIDQLPGAVTDRAAFEVVFLHRLLGVRTSEYAAVLRHVCHFKLTVMAG